MLISRKTLISLLFALLLGAGLVRWRIARKDECSAFLAGNLHAPSSQVVETGSRIVLVPCQQWLPRQPVSVQILCLVDFIFAVTFLLNGIGDLRTHLERRAQIRRPRYEPE